ALGCSLPREDFLSVAAIVVQAVAVAVALSFHRLALDFVCPVRADLYPFGPHHLFCLGHPYYPDLCFPDLFSLLRLSPLLSCPYPYFCLDFRPSVARHILSL